MLEIVDLETGEIMSPERRLAELEARIERGIKTFIDVGDALMEIRDNELYGKGYRDFETYCRDRWGFTRRHANRLIDAATVVGELGPIGPETPRNEAQVRELARIEPERRAEVWTEAVETHGEKVTARDIRQIVETTPPRSIDQAADEVSDPAEKSALDRLRYISALTRTMSQATGLLAFEPDDVAAVIDPAFKEAHIDAPIKCLAEWAARIERAMPAGLYVVEGQTKT